MHAEEQKRAGLGSAAAQRIPAVLFARITLSLPPLLAALYDTAYDTLYISDTAVAHCVIILFKDTGGGLRTSRSYK